MNSIFIEQQQPKKNEDEKKNCLKDTYFPCLTIQHHYHSTRHFMSAIRLNVDCIRGRNFAVYHRHNAKNNNSAQRHTHTGRKKQPDNDEMQKETEQC